MLFLALLEQDFRDWIDVQDEFNRILKQLIIYENGFLSENTFSHFSALKFVILKINFIYETYFLCFVHIAISNHTGK
jgi:hypothetical protein